YDMPVINGPEMVRRLKKEDPSLRAILMSAREPDEDTHEELERFPFLAKPIRIEELLETITRVAPTPSDSALVLRVAFSLERLNDLARTGFGTATGFDPGSVMGDPVGSAVATLFAMVGSLALLAPVVWVYMLTKQREGYDESVVHTVVILPMPVVGLVIVVQNSVALAFSLAGIVAAVRFRNTLKDTKDAVYIFLAIGTALAAGVQALGIAVVTSIIFNFVVLVMWQLKIGNIYADQGRITPKMRLGDVLAGAGSAGAGSGNLTIGDPELLAALTPDELGEVAVRKARISEILRSPEFKKFSGILIVHADESDECLVEIDAVLEEYTKEFSLSEVTTGEDGLATLMYLIAPSSETTPTQLVSVLRSRVGSYIRAAEYRTIRKEKSKQK
ncbi:MAG: DUF4956 domain-containing protein, partial [Gemmatimonadales bacterium]